MELAKYKACICEGCIMTGFYSVLGKVSSLNRFPKFFVLETVSFLLSVSDYKNTVISVVFIQ